MRAVKINNKKAKFPAVQWKNIRLHAGLTSLAQRQQCPDMTEAIVLIGPTGSGKTPLGELLEARGLWGRPCAHFDFGRELRHIAGGRAAERFSDSEVGFIRGVLESGTLLEDRHFHLAERIIHGYLEDRRLDQRCIVALNGLPRHVGQAAGLGAMLDVRAVVVLSCPPQVVTARIAANTGGDRTGRTDDNPQAVARRMELFQARTAPLADYYRLAGAEIITVEVARTTTPQEMLEELNSHAAGTDVKRII